MRAMGMHMEPRLSGRPFLERWRNIAGFWLLGLFNNSAYVIMLAGANEISSAAVGLVYLCAVSPGMLLKLSAPYWFHRASYSKRILAAALLMSSSFSIVAFSGSRGWQLFGVVLASVQGGLGEASILALTSHYHSQTTITAWSSGTGFAGVFGYAWVAVFHVMLAWSLRSTLLTAHVIVVAWLLSFFLLLEPPDARQRSVSALLDKDRGLVEAAMRIDADSNSQVSTTYIDNDQGSSRYEPVAAEDVGVLSSHPSAPLSRRLHQSTVTTNMCAKERLRRTLALWPYTVPLVVVYFAEYALQSGVWPAIGFPVDSSSARSQFYVYSNWTYQVGVFVSRSSGSLWQARRQTLWLMPAAQVFVLCFFSLDAVYHFWYNWGLIMLCFATGCLGGAVYVQAFSMIAREVEPRFREFSLGAASVADSLGIAFADIAGIFIQGCLFKANKLSGADFSC